MEDLAAWAPAGREVMADKSRHKSHTEAPGEPPDDPGIELFEEAGAEVCAGDGIETGGFFAEPACVFVEPICEPGGVFPKPDGVFAEPTCEPACVFARAA